MHTPPFTASAPIPFQPLLTTAQAAALLGLSPRTLEGLRLRGGGPRYVRLSARAVRYRREDLAAWIDAGVRTNTAEAA